MKTTIALATVAVLGFGVVAHGQSASTVIHITAGEVTANGQGRGSNVTIRIGNLAILSADQFELEPSGTMRLLGNVQLGVDPSRTPSFAVRVPSAGGLNLRLLDMVITATGVEPDYQAGVLRLLGDVRIRQERPDSKR